MTDRRYVTNVELRAATDGEMRIEGCAIRYNSLSFPNVPATGCREKIAPGAFTRSLQSTEVQAFYAHDNNALLGRTSNGTLQLKDSTDGLRFSLRLNPNVSLHRDVHALCADRTLRGMSFGFLADEDAWEKGTDAQGKRCNIRTVKSGRIFEISVTGQPAYPSTDAQARALVGPQGEPIIVDGPGVLAYDFAETDAETRQVLEASDVADRYGDLVEKFDKVRLW